MGWVTDAMGVLCFPGGLYGSYQVYATIRKRNIAEVVKDSNDDENDDPSGQDMVDTFDIAVKVSPPPQMSDEERTRAEAYYLRKRLAEACADYDEDALNQFAAELRALDPDAADLLYFDAFICYLAHMHGYRYNNSAEREKVEQERRLGLTSARSKVQRYTEECPYDANGWLLLAKLEHYMHAPGWSRRAISAISGGIRAESTRSDLRFYRGELAARAIHPDDLDLSARIRAMDDLRSFLRQEPDHARAWRILAGLYEDWPGSAHTNAADLAEICRKIAGHSDGRWRADYRRTASIALLASSITGALGFLLLPHIGLRTVGILLGLLAYFVGAYCIALLLRSVSSGHSYFPLFDIRGRSEYSNDDYPEWLDKLPPGPPNRASLLEELEKGTERLLRDAVAANASATGSALSGGSSVR